MNVPRADIVRITPIRGDQSGVQLTVLCPYCNEEHTLFAYASEFSERFGLKMRRCSNDARHIYRARWPEARPAR